MSATEMLLRRLACAAAGAILLALFALAGNGFAVTDGQPVSLLDVLYSTTRVLAGLGPPEFSGAFRDSAALVLQTLVILAGLAFRIYVFAVVTAWFVIHDVATRMDRQESASKWLIRLAGPGELKRRR